jgi:PAS domain S-box-containing protein
MVRSALERAGSLDFEYRIRREGDVRWVRSSGRVHLDDGGQPQRLIGLSIDATRWKRLELALRESEARYRRLIETANEGVWIFDAGGFTTYTNEQCARMLGYSTLEMLGRRFSDLAAPEDVTHAEVTFERRRTGIRERFDIRLRRKDGEPVWVVVATSSILDDQGRLVGALAMISDITEHRELLERLERKTRQLLEADRLKDNFLITLGHELRQPLNALRVATQLARVWSESERLLRPLGVVDRQVAHLARLVDDLVDASRVKRGKLQVDMRPFDLREAVEGAVEAVRPVTVSAGQHLTVELPAEAVPVKGDADRLRQVVSNLLNNATRYAPEGGTIDLKLATHGQEAVLVVQDDGPGIPPAVMPRLFDLFVQANEADGAGLGIGLALVKGIVNLHGGSVAARNRADGAGAQFVVRLPLAAVLAGVTAQEPDREGT